MRSTPTPLFGAPTRCQVCRTEFTPTSIIIDGRMKYGTWGYMCEECHSEYGVGFGIGKATRHIAVPLKKGD